MNNKPNLKVNCLKENNIDLRNKAIRFLWNFIWLLLYRPSPILMHSWRCFLLRCFGAKVAKGALPYPSARIWAPWNLTMGEDSCLSHQVDCYSVDQIIIGNRVTVSQYSFLCTATHDHRGKSMPLMTGPIHIGDDAWITADVFIGPGVIVGKGAVVGARSTVVSNVSAWSIVAGNPAKNIGSRAPY